MTTSGVLLESGERNKMTEVFLRWADGRVDAARGFGGPALSAAGGAEARSFIK